MYLALIYFLFKSREIQLSENYSNQERENQTEPSK